MPETTEDLRKLSRDELREICSTLGVSPAVRWTREELATAIEDARARISAASPALGRPLFCPVREDGFRRVGFGKIIREGATLEDIAAHLPICTQFADDLLQWVSEYTKTPLGLDPVAAVDAVLNVLYNCNPDERSEPDLAASIHTAHSSSYVGTRVKISRALKCCAPGLTALQFAAIVNNAQRYLAHIGGDGGIPPIIYTMHDEAAKVRNVRGRNPVDTYEWPDGTKMILGPNTDGPDVSDPQADTAD